MSFLSFLSLLGKATAPAATETLAAAANVPVRVFDRTRKRLEEEAGAKSFTVSLTSDLSCAFLRSAKELERVLDDAVVVALRSADFSANLAAASPVGLRILLLSIKHKKFINHDIHQ